MSLLVVPETGTVAEVVFKLTEDTGVRYRTDKATTAASL